jgi:hypothetical protein
VDKVFACLLTIIIEMIVISLFHKNLTKMQLLTLLISSIPLNILTNASLNIVLEYFYSYEISQYLIIVFFLELIVVIVEALVYFFIIKKKTIAVYISLLANTTSFLIGSFLLNLILNVVKYNY